MADEVEPFDAVALGMAELSFFGEWLPRGSLTGILGGMGPQATMDFEVRLHRVAQQLIPQHFGFGYPPIVVRYCRWRLRHGRLQRPPQPSPGTGRCSSRR